MSKPPFQHKARKRFGQNFLVDHGVINMIVRAVGPRETDNLVEIGPGQGAITALLLEGCPNLNVIELDRDLIPGLLAQFAKYRQFKIHQADALQFDFTQLLPNPNEKLRIVGNLPYNISTPLLFHLLNHKDIVADMHFMLQKEVVLRLASQPNDKNYGKLSIMAQYLCAVEFLFEVPPESFQPAPKVDSAIVRLTPYQQLPYVAKNPKKLALLVREAFQQRRKTLRNAFKNLITDVPIDSVGLDLNQRAENLSVKDYVELCNQLWPNS